MTGPAVLILAVPGPWPGSHESDSYGFRDLVLSARTVERRRDRGYHLGQEDLRRFGAASAGIERLGRLNGRVLASVGADVLRRFDTQTFRARAGFHPPELAPHWLHALATLLADSGRTQALQAADFVAATGQGLVLSPGLAPNAPHWIRNPMTAVRATERSLPAPEIAAGLRAEVPDWSAFTAESDRARLADRFWAECADALATGQPIMLGAGARHEVITEVLNHAGAVVSSRTGLRILYADGSEAEPFALQRPRIDRHVGGRTLRVGLMSMRHTELDLDVDGYWFRNRMVSTTRTLAEADAFCAAATEGRLAKVTAAGVGRIELVHTGFEPAVVGFYRGLLRHLVSVRTPVQVQPIYLIGGYTDGSVWGAA